MMLAARELNIEQAAREQPQLDQREADLHARLRRHDEPGERVHAGRAADADPQQHAGPEHDPGLKVTRPEIYFGELTNTDVYVKTRQKEFNYPQGETNNLTSYEGNGGIVLGGFFRRLLIALDRGDLTQAAVQRRHHAGQPAADAAQHPRSVEALAPFLTFDPDPYIVVGDDGRLSG